MTPDRRLRAVQYWDSGAPPAEVAALMQSWAGDAEFDYRAYDRASAQTYIRRNYNKRVQRAFARCAVPAMQADFFRYCALFAEGGLYLDADTENLGGLPGLLDGAGRGVLMDRRGKIANDVMYVAAREDPLLGAVIAQAVHNIESEASQNVWLVTGPGIPTALHQDAAQAALFDGFRILPVQDIGRCIRFDWHLDYKQGETDWRNVASLPGGSIFS